MPDNDYDMQVQAEDSKRSAEVSDSALLPCPIAWVSVKDRLPEEGQLVVVYVPSNQPVTSFHTTTWWRGDEREVTHWAELTEPEQ